MQRSALIGLPLGEAIPTTSPPKRFERELPRGQSLTVSHRKNGWVPRKRSSWLIVNVKHPNNKPDIQHTRYGFTIHLSTMRLEQSNAVFFSRANQRHWTKCTYSTPACYHTWIHREFSLSLIKGRGADGSCHPISGDHSRWAMSFPFPYVADMLVHTPLLLREYGVPPSSSKESTMA